MAAKQQYVKIGGVNRDPVKRAASELRYRLKHLGAIRSRRREAARKYRREHDVTPSVHHNNDTLAFTGEWPKVRLTLRSEDIFSGKGISAFSAKGYGLVVESMK